MNASIVRAARAWIPASFLWNADHYQWLQNNINNNKFTSASISKQGLVRSPCYWYQFSFILKSELITITKVSHFDSKLGNGILVRQ